MSKRIELDRPDNSDVSMVEEFPGPSNIYVLSHSDSSQELTDSILFEELPVEMIHRIFKEISIVDVVKLRGGCRLVNDAIRLYIRNSMMDLRLLGNDVLVWLVEKLKTIPVNREHMRLELVKGIYFIRSADILKISWAK